MLGQQRDLSLIAELKYEMYFLTVRDLVVFARARHILCQGRGLAANSAVCYGLTFVTLEDDPGTVNVIVWKSLQERQRPELMHSRLLAVYCVWQRDAKTGGQVRHLIAGI